jgi:hypothetical protein
MEQSFWHFDIFLVYWNVLKFKAIWLLKDEIQEIFINIRKKKKKMNMKEKHRNKSQ